MKSSTRLYIKPVAGKNSLNKNEIKEVDYKRYILWVVFEGMYGVVDETAVEIKTLLSIM